MKKRLPSRLGSPVFPYSFAVTQPEDEEPHKELIAELIQNEFKELGKPNEHPFYDLPSIMSLVKANRTMLALTQPASQKEQVIGYMLWTLESQEKISSIKYLLIHYVGVTMAHRRRGVMRHMLMSLARKFPVATYFMCQATSGSEVVYKNMGWIRGEVPRIYYQTTALIPTTYTIKPPPGVSFRVGSKEDARYLPLCMKTNGELNNPILIQAAPYQEVTLFHGTKPLFKKVWSDFFKRDLFHNRLFILRAIQKRYLVDPAMIHTFYPACNQPQKRSREVDDSGLVSSSKKASLENRPNKGVEPEAVANSAPARF